MTEGSVSRRYARAFFELARETQQESLLEQLGADLEKLSAAAAASGEGVNVLANPTFTLSERKLVLDQLLPALNLHPITNNFARLLLDKGRFGNLPLIVVEYQALADDAAGRVRAEVIASGEMSAEVKSAVASALSKATGRQVVLSTRVDTSLLGGLVARVGGQVFDASLRTRLDNIQRSLLEQA